MIWDDTSVLSAAADRTVRYWDLEQAEDEEYDPVVMRGHLAGITQLKRLNNSYTRAVSSSMDGTVKIWDVASGICTGDFGDHEGIGITRIAMNQKCMISYSDQNNTMVVRDFERGSCLMKINSFNDSLLSGIS